MVVFGDGCGREAGAGETAEFWGTFLGVAPRFSALRPRPLLYLLLECYCLRSGTNSPLLRTFAPRVCWLAFPNTRTKCLAIAPFTPRAVVFVYSFNFTYDRPLRICCTRFLQLATRLSTNLSVGTSAPWLHLGHWTITFIKTCPCPSPAGHTLKPSPSPSKNRDNRGTERRTHSGV